jgi:hypothetical protein
MHDQYVGDGGIDAQFCHQVPDSESGMSFAFNTVRVYGDRSDLERLRGRSLAHRFARHALAALKRLDAGQQQRAAAYDV